MRVSREEFEALVEEALEQLPEEFKAALDNVAVMVEEEPSEEDLEEVGIDPDDPDRDDLLGLYQGTPSPSATASTRGSPTGCSSSAGRSCAPATRAVR